MTAISGSSGANPFTAPQAPAQPPLSTSATGSSRKPHRSSSRRHVASEAPALLPTGKKTSAVASAVVGAALQPPATPPPALPTSAQDQLEALKALRAAKKKGQAPAAPVPAAPVSTAPAPATTSSSKKTKHSSAPAASPYAGKSHDELVAMLNKNSKLVKDADFLATLKAAGSATSTAKSSQPSSSSEDSSSSDSSTSSSSSSSTSSSSSGSSSSSTSGSSKSSSSSTDETSSSSTSSSSSESAKKSKKKKSKSKPKETKAERKARERQEAKAAARKTLLNGINHASSEVSKVVEQTHASWSAHAAGHSDAKGKPQKVTAHLPGYFQSHMQFAACSLDPEANKEIVAKVGHVVLANVVFKTVPSDVEVKLNGKTLPARIITEITEQAAEKPTKNVSAQVLFFVQAGIEKAKLSFYIPGRTKDNAREHALKLQLENVVASKSGKPTVEVTSEVKVDFSKESFAVALNLGTLAKPKAK